MNNQNSFMHEFIVQHGDELENEHFPDTVEGTNGPVLVLPTNSYEFVIEFCDNNKDFVYKFMLPLLKHGIDNNLDTIEYFRIGNTEMIMTVDKSDIRNSLMDLMEYFIEVEEYELAGECKAYLIKHIISTLLDSI